MTAATMCGWGLVNLSSQEEGTETKNAQCLFGRSGTKGKEVEDKFATYWPRNIMILFGPPGGFDIICHVLTVISLSQE